jgi:hypothetical protein
MGVGWGCVGGEDRVMQIVPKVTNLEGPCYGDPNHHPDRHPHHRHHPPHLNQTLFRNSEFLQG